MRNNVNTEIAIFLIESISLKEGAIQAIKNIYANLTLTAKQKVNRMLITKLANLFEDPFAAYLEKKMHKELRSVDFAQILADAQDGDLTAIDKIKYTLLDSMFDYYEHLLKSRLFKTSLTGDKTIDQAYSKTVAALFNSSEFVELFYDDIDSILKGKMDKIDDIDLSETSKAKTAYRYVKSLGNRSTMLKYKVSDKLLSYVPNVDAKLKKYIHSLIMNMDSKVLGKLTSRWDIKSVANALSEPIIEYIHNKIQTKYLTGPSLKIFNKILISILKSEEAEKIFKKQLLNAFTMNKLAKKN